MFCLHGCMKRQGCLHTAFKWISLGSHKKAVSKDILSLNTISSLDLNDCTQILYLVTVYIFHVHNHVVF